MQIETIMSSKAAMLVLAVLAFLIAAILVLVIVRMLFGGKLRMPGSRARQARLGIVDAFDLDRQRQLIIVRRDNIEHLIMIGGPNDLLIESEIVRVEARDLRGRDKALEAGFADARIPAPPFTPVERPEMKAPAEAPPPADEPLLPIPLPEIAMTPAREVGAPPARDVAVPPPAEIANGEPPAPALPARGPTFPLPPRRPPERRAPLPPRLPEGVTRGPQPTPSAAAEPVPAAAPPAPVAETAANGPGPSPVAAPASPPAAAAAPDLPAATGLGAPAPIAPRPGPTFRPLPPRPPVRPLQRVTSKSAAPAVGPSAASPGPLPPVPAPAPMPSAPVLPPEAAPQPQPQPQQPQPPAEPPAQEEDLSLEEEMAKLLGRG